MKTLDEIKDILELHPSARNDDFELIAIFARTHGIYRQPLSEALATWQNRQLPPFETITRARRKLQEQYPHLRANDTIRHRRAESEERHREFFGQQKCFDI